MGRSRTQTSQAHVYVVCACFVICIQHLKLNKKQLKVHKDRFSVDKYMPFYKNNKLSEPFSDYYKILGLPQMFLSPRST